MPANGPASLESSSATPLDVLIVGAGPTGLALATHLQLFGTSFRLIDRAFDRARESRAMAVQARTLELLQAVGLGDELVASGRTSTRLALHFGARAVATVTLGDIGATDTRFPFILFVSQAETERLLGRRLTARGVTIERGVELSAFEMRENGVSCLLRHDDGREERVETAYLVGCDGAHSTVRKGAGFTFEGASYPQEFVLGDVEADGSLEAGALNSYAGKGGVAMFFPLGEPTTWRVVAMRAERQAAGKPEVDPGNEATIAPLTLEELQEIVTPPTGGSVRVRDPAWLTHFRLHHRQIERYQRGRVFLAGDAAHIHSPVGAQGMNTGVQDAWNLGWKLALVSRGVAQSRLVDTYNEERWPVGRFLLRYTDRLFSTFTRAMSSGRLATLARELVVARILPLVLRSRRLRAVGFRFVSELGIHYRESSAVTEGRPKLRRGPRAGERLPDTRLVHLGHEVSMQEVLSGPFLAILLCGDPEAWETRPVTALTAGRGAWIRVFHLTREDVTDALVDRDGRAHALLGVSDAAQYLVRPDGYVAFRCAGRNLNGLEQYLTAWYPGR